MAATITLPTYGSPPGTWGNTFLVSNLANGANALTFPTTQGPTGLGLDHVPSYVRMTCYNTGAQGATSISYDPSTLTANGVTLYATGVGNANTGCVLEVF